MAGIKFTLILLGVAAFAMLSKAQDSEKIETSDTLGLGYYRGAYPYNRGYAGYPYSPYYRGYRYGGYYPYGYHGYYG